MIGIYEIQDVGKGMYYIGQSKHIEKRLLEHWNQANTALMEDELHYEMRKRPEHFIMRVLCLCDIDSLDMAEQTFIDKRLANGYKLYNKIDAPKHKSAGEPTYVGPAKTERDVIKFLNSLMGKPLFVEDKEMIARYLNYRDTRGNLLKWRTIKQKLLANGFEILETKRTIRGKTRNCSIINVKFNY